MGETNGGETRFGGRSLLFANGNEEEESRALLTSSNREVEVGQRMRYLICIASIGGFLSGYNTGVLSGALLPLSRVFSLSSLEGKPNVSI